MRGKEKKVGIDDRDIKTRMVASRGETISFIDILSFHMGIQEEVSLN